MLRAGGKADVRAHFESLTDPRRGKSIYPLINVVANSSAAELCA